MKPEVVEGLEVLDLDDGAGWELLCSLMAYKPSERCGLCACMRLCAYMSTDVVQRALSCCSEVHKYKIQRFKRRKPYC